MHEHQICLQIKLMQEFYLAAFQDEGGRLLPGAVPNEKPERVLSAD